jgi:hypothetical protein
VNDAVHIGLDVHQATTSAQREVTCNLVRGWVDAGGAGAYVGTSR